MKLRLNSTLFPFSSSIILHITLGLATTLFSSFSLAQDVPFTADQVKRGNSLYREHCQICHGSTLANGQFGTPLKGSFFRNNWVGKSLGELVKFTYESMPPDNVMMLAPQQYAEVIAFILEANGMQAGEAPINGDFDALSATLLPW